MTEGGRGQQGHETFDHTADVGLRAWGRDLAELFEEAAAALIETLLDPETVRSEQAVTVRAQGQDAEDLLVGWLEELVFLSEAENFAPAAAKVEELSENTVQGTVWGEPVDPDRHWFRSEVKAVTYHDLAIRETETGYAVEIVLDV
jgi:SHS2 domain-containing protein